MKISPDGDEIVYKLVLQVINDGKSMSSCNHYSDVLNLTTGTGCIWDIKDIIVNSALPSNVYAKASDIQENQNPNVSILYSHIDIIISMYYSFVVELSILN